MKEKDAEEKNGRGANGKKLLKLPGHFLKLEKG